MIDRRYGFSCMHIKMSGIQNTSSYFTSFWKHHWDFRIERVDINCRADTDDCLGGSQAISVEMDFFNSITGWRRAVWTAAHRCLAFSIWCHQHGNWCSARAIWLATRKIGHSIFLTNNRMNPNNLDLQTFPPAPPQGWCVVLRDVSLLTAKTMEFHEIIRHKFS